MQIDIIQTTMHVYDANEEKIFVTNDVIYTVPFIEWINKLLTTTDLKFVLEYQSFFKNAANYAQDFLTISERIFQKMVKNLDIAPADMAYVECMIDKKKAIVGLKLNYQVNYTHQKHVDKISLLQLKTAYPKKVNEAFIYFVESKKLLICEKDYEEDGKRVSYLSYHALEIENTARSNRAKLKLLKNCVHKVNQEYFPGDISAQIESFDRIQNELLSQKQRSVEKIIEITYDDVEHQNRLRTLLTQRKISSVEQITTEENITSIISNKKFKNDLGIEVKLASHLLQDPSAVVLKKNDDDSYEITIKNVFLKS